MVVIAGDGLAIARTRPVVRVMMVTSFLIGLSSEAFDRLWTKHLIDSFDFPELPWSNDIVLWFGMIELGGMLLSLLGAEALKRFHPGSLRPGTPTRLLATLATGRVVATGLFAFAGSLWLAIGAFWLRGLVMTAFYPTSEAWLNRNLESRTRATVLSFTEQVASVGEIGGGPPLGWVGSRFGVARAIIASALIFTPAVGVLARASQLQDHVAEPETVPVEDPA